MTEQTIIDHEPDPNSARGSRLRHAHDLAATIVDRLNAEQENFALIRDGSGLNSYVQLNPSARTIIESYLRENL